MRLRKYYGEKLLKRRFGIILMVSMALWLTGCCSDDHNCQEHFKKIYVAGEHISVSSDSIATVESASTRAAEGTDIASMPGYLTILTTHYWTNDDGDFRLIEDNGIEAMHNVSCRVRVKEGNPATIRSLTCKLSGLASRFDIKKLLLMSPVAEAHSEVEITGNDGNARFRILGAATEHQSLALHLVTSDDEEYDVEVDVTDILSGLRPTPFKVSAETAKAISIGKETDISQAIETEVKIELKVTVNVDIEIRLPDPLTGAEFSAAIVNWNENVEDINVY